MIPYAHGDHFPSQPTGALASARAVVPLVQRYFSPSSLLDVGCGAGAWVRAWREAGVRDAVGVDAPAQLTFRPGPFRPLDIARPFRLGRRFDVAQCPDLAEHLDPQASEILVDNLVAHAPVVVFSAAPPGGEHPAHERPHQWWRELFEQRGYGTYDCLRPRIAERVGVANRYRYNLLVFVRRQDAAGLPAEVASCHLAPTQPVPDVAPLPWRARRWVLARLPAPLVAQVATLKHRLVLHGAGARQA